MRAGLTVVDEEEPILLAGRAQNARPHADIACDGTAAGAAARASSHEFGIAEVVGVLQRGRVDLRDFVVVIAWRSSRDSVHLGDVRCFVAGACVLGKLGGFLDHASSTVEVGVVRFRQVVDVRFDVFESSDDIIEAVLCLDVRHLLRLKVTTVVIAESIITASVIAIVGQFCVGVAVCIPAIVSIAVIVSWRIGI